MTDTEKADELLRTEIERLILELDECAKHDPDTKKALEPVIFLSGRKLSLLETIQKDREALKEMLRSATPHPTDNPAMFKAWQSGNKALASQDQTLIKTLS